MLCLIPLATSKSGSHSHLRGRDDAGCDTRGRSSWVILEFCPLWGSRGRGKGVLEHSLVGHQSSLIKPGTWHRFQGNWACKGSGVTAGDRTQVSSRDSVGSTVAPKSRVRLLEKTTCVCTHAWGRPWWLSGKEPTCQCRRRRFDPWVGRIPWRRKWQTHSSVLDWRILWTQEPGRLQSVGS